MNWENPHFPVFFSSFSLLLLPGDVGKKNVAWDSSGIHILSKSWRECPQSSCFSINTCIFLVQRCKEDLKKTNIWVFVWSLFRSQQICICSFVIVQGEILSRLKLLYLVSIKNAWEVMHMLCNFLSRPVSDQEWGLCEIPGRLRGIFCMGTVLTSDKLLPPKIFIFLPTTQSLYCDGTNTRAPSGPCEPGYYCTGGAKSALQHVVMEGHYSSAGAFKPEPCPLGSFQPVSIKVLCTLRCLCGLQSHCTRVWIIICEVFISR